MKSIQVRLSTCMVNMLQKFEKGCGTVLVILRITDLYVQQPMLVIYSMQVYPEQLKVDAPIHLAKKAAFVLNTNHAH